MSIAFGASIGTKAASAVSTTNFPTTTNVPSSGLIVGGVGLYKNGTVTSVTISGGGLTWTTDKFVTPYATDLNYTVAIFNGLAPVGLSSGTTTTLTLNGGGTAFAITFGAVYFTGADISTPLDVANSGAGVNGNQNWTSNITTTNANDAIVAYSWIDFYGGGTITPGSGWGAAADFSLVNATDTDTAGMVHQIVSSTGTYSPNGTFGGGGPWITVAAAYKEAAGAAAAAPTPRTFNAIPFMGGVL